MNKIPHIAVQKIVQKGSLIFAATVFSCIKTYLQLGFYCFFTVLHIPEDLIDVIVPYMFAI